MEAALLARYRTALDELREDLRKQLSDMGANPDDPSLDNIEFAGFADSAQVTAERDKVLAVTDRLRDQLAEVERARAKMETGEYGTCERCGQPISPERLEALPYSTLCVSCKQSA